MHAVVYTPAVTPADRLGLTVFVAVVAHLLVILGVSFTHEDRRRDDVSTLDVVLVQSRSPETPEDAQLLAQANQDGGGESERPEKPATPLAAPFLSTEARLAAVAAPRPPSPEIVSRAAEAPDARPHESDPLPPPATPKPVLAQTERLAQQRVPVEPELDLATRKLHVAQAKVDDLPQRESPRAPAPREASEQPPDQPVDAATLINRSLAMASLSATIDQRMQAYAQRPRRKWVTARTREHRFAAYMEAWRAKVERIGNLNYPDEARRRRLSGDLLLDVALNPDGTINEIVLRRSSGQKVLDDAAVRIVELSAPFGRFPESFRDEVDILHIERTWRFSSRNHFASR